MGLSWASHSTLIYTSTLILCSTICVHSATRHNIHMYPQFGIVAYLWLKTCGIQYRCDELIFFVSCATRNTLSLYPACKYIINNYSPKAKWILVNIPETKSRGIFTTIYEPEANNCFSIIIQVIIEIPKQRNVTILPQFAIVDKSSYHVALINGVT